MYLFLLFFSFQDNETSYSALLTNGIGLIIEYWKVRFYILNLFFIFFINTFTSNIIYYLFR